MELGEIAKLITKEIQNTKDKDFLIVLYIYIARHNQKEAV